MKRRLLSTTAVLAAIALLGAGCASTPTPKATTPAAPKAVAAAPVQPTIADAIHNLETEYQQAQALRAAGKLADATRVLAQLVLVAPDDPRIVGDYGKVLVQQGRSEDAAAFLKRAVELKPSDATLFSALGVAYDQMDDRKNAKVAYESALALHPHDPAVLNNFAVSRMLAGDLDGAQRLLSQAQTAGANNPKVASNLAWLAQLRAGKKGSSFATAPSLKPPREIVADAVHKPAATTSPSAAPAVQTPVPSATNAGAPPAATQAVVANATVARGASGKPGAVIAPKPPRNIVVQPAQNGPLTSPAAQSSMEEATLHPEAEKPSARADHKSPMPKNSAAPQDKLIRTAAMKTPAQRKPAEADASAHAKTAAVKAPVAAKTAAAKALSQATASAPKSGPPVLRTAAQGE